MEKGREKLSKPSVKVPPLNWPTSEDVFLPLPHEGIDTPQGRLTAVAICDESGAPRLRFAQGERAWVFVEWEIKETLPDRALSSGLLLQNAAGLVVFGKDTYQVSSPAFLLDGTRKGWRLRTRYALSLRLAPGEYHLTVGFAGLPRSVWAAYSRGEIDYFQMQKSVEEWLRVTNVGVIEVTLSAGGKLLHHGITDLVEEAVFEAAPPIPVSSPPALVHSDEFSDLPAIIHITHQKSGSQWVHQILRSLFRKRVVAPQLGNAHFLNTKVRQGWVYPTVYITKEEFDTVHLPSKWYRFIIVRDLRDTLVSGYFSIRYSHPLVDVIPAWRAALENMSEEEGLLWALDHWLPEVAAIAASWARAGERLIKYEDLLRKDVEIFKRLLIEESGWPVDPRQLEEAVISHRFDKLTGRKPGQEDVRAHERKGAPGDWRNHFTSRVTEAFKERYGEILILTGYETDMDW